MAKQEEKQVEKVYTGNSAAFIEAEEDVAISARRIGEMKSNLNAALKEHTEKVLALKGTMGGALRFSKHGVDYCIVVRPTDGGEGETAFIREFTPRGKTDPAKKVAKAEKAQERAHKAAEAAKVLKAAVKGESSSDLDEDGDLTSLNVEEDS